MATPAPQPTRQHLDDLDALLQRMLALPVDPSDEAAPPEPSVEPEPVYHDALTPPPGNMIVADAGALPPPPRPTPRPAVVSAPVSLPLLNPLAPAERRAPILPPPDQPRSPLQSLIASRPPRPPLVLRPILWLNRRFDGLAFALGMPGRWLRRPIGRTVLGIVGLLLLAAAVVLALRDRIGWTW